MNFTEQAKKHQWLIFLIAIFLISAILLGVAYYIFTKTYEGRIYPNVYIGKVNLGGQTPEAAEKILKEKINIIEQNGIIFDYIGHKAVLSPLLVSAEGTNFQIINFDAKKTVERAYAIGRGLNFLINISDRLKSAGKIRQIPAALSHDFPKIKNDLSEEFSTYEAPAQNAKLTYTTKEDNNFSFSVETEKSGLVADYEKGIKQMLINLQNLDNSNINLENKQQDPEIYTKDCLNIEAKAETALAFAPFFLTYNDEKKVINREIYVDWLALGKSDDQADKVKIVLDEIKVKEYLQKKVAEVVNKPPKDSKFTIKNGRVVEFQNSEDGVELDLDASFKKINDGIAENNKSIELVLKTIKSTIADQNVNDSGIKDKLGTGKSNFAGSPKNRRHNIATGASSLNGLLIKPDEEFSTIKSLGAIDGSTGYLTELVIKENKTVPEYGGGLCQIGTTMFRAALASGLPITMRRNHSYRVVYYEPAGTDATIYDPLPDLRFKNDTGNYILIQSRIEGDNLYFDFWGTKDGRQATTTYPKIYNIVKPQPTKIIETTDLKPGEKKCTESSHNGADAYFDYTVTYANGEKKEERYSSHYVPWRAVCLVGVEQKTDTSLSTSTPEIVETKTN